MPKPRYASIGALATTVVIIPLAYLIIRRQTRFLSGALAILSKRSVLPKLRKLTPRVQSLRSCLRVLQTSQRSFLSIFLLDMCFHVAGVAEVFITLSFISPVAPTLTQAFIPESRIESSTWRLSLFLCAPV